MTNYKYTKGYIVKIKMHSYIKFNKFLTSKGLVFN